MKTGLVMEGGAMRGMFTAGVTDVLMENGIEFDGAIGVSAGAVFGCNYKSHQIGRTIRYNKKYCRDKRYVSFRSLLKTGNLYGVEFAYHLLPEKLDPFDLDTFQSSPMEFYVVCTDVETGEAVYHKCLKGDGEDLEWMRASASLPLVSELVRIGDRLLSDGGNADSVPLEYFRSIGYNRNVVVMTQPASYIKKQNKLMPIIRLALKKYPEFLTALSTRPERYNEQVRKISELEKNEPDNVMIIRPDAPLEIGAVEHNPDNLERVYRIGREMGERRLEEIQAFLAK